MNSNSFFAFIFLQVFTFSQKVSVNFQLLLRLIQGITFMAFVTGVVVVVFKTKLTVEDLFSSMLAFIPTGWGILCVSFLK